jgi:hypothetical protein
MVAQSAEGRSVKMGRRAPLAQILQIAVIIDIDIDIDNEGTSCLTLP